MTDPAEMPRWTATVFYRTTRGLYGQVWQFEELAELHNLIEHGPNFYTIDRIEIRLTGRCEPMTVEAAEGALAHGGTVQ